ADRRDPHEKQPAGEIEGRPYRRVPAGAVGWRLSHHCSSRRILPAPGTFDLLAFHGPAAADPSPSATDASTGAPRPRAPTAGIATAPTRPPLPPSLAAGCARHAPAGGRCHLGSGGGRRSHLPQ